MSERKCVRRRELDVQSQMVSNSTCRIYKHSSGKPETRSTHRTRRFAFFCRRCDTTSGDGGLRREMTVLRRRERRGERCGVVLVLTITTAP